MIEVMMIGSPVFIGADIRALITGVLIREHNYTQYECSWWDGKTHNCKWLDQSEVSRSKETPSTKIGFTK